MIDWGKVGPANAPGPTAPTTTTPVAPVAPGAMQAPEPMKFGTGSMQPGELTMTQVQKDQMSPGDTIGRGWDQLGNFLFGEKSVAHNTPLADIVGGVGAGIGKVAGSLGAGVYKPFEVGANVLHAIPLGWVPGGADETFGKIGAYAQANDPALYDKWQKVDAAAAGQWGAGDLHANFNVEAEKYLDDQRHDSALGTDQTLAIGKEGIGSVGGALSSAIGAFLGLGSGFAQKSLGDIGFFNPADPTTGANRVNNPLTGQPMTRVEESAQRLAAGGAVSEVEQKAIDAVASGEWSIDHANTYLVTHGQGISKDPLTQIVGSVVTDPLTWATMGAGGLAKMGKVGADIAESGLQATTAYEKASVVINAAQKARPLAGVVPDLPATYGRLASMMNTVKNGELGGALRIMRGMIDPLSVYKPSSVENAVTDLANGQALDSLSRGYGAQTITDWRALTREAGLTTEGDSALGAYAKDQANLMIMTKAQKSMLNEGLGEDMVHGNVGSPDALSGVLTENAAKDGGTELADHIQRVAKNTFTAEEDAHLAGRLATTLGHDVPYWTQKIAGMSNELKSLAHAQTFKLTEVPFEQARAAVDIGSYAGDLPIRNLTLVSADTLDNITAESVIANIRDTLKAPVAEMPDRLAAATSEWNRLAQRYPLMDNIGYAPGGKDQLEAMVAQLEKKLQSGGITRILTDEELATPELKAMRNVIDSHSMPLTAEQAAAAQPLWKVGFRPDEEVAWSLQRDAATGLYKADGAPTISHVVDAVPGRQPFSDTTRNFLGQIVGKSKAEHLNGPIDSMEAALNTMRDGITGQRLVNNIDRRFERSTFDVGVPKSISKDIMRKAKDVAALDRTTLRGVNPTNVWQAIHDVIPRDLVLKDGSHLNIHTVMDHLLQAAEGDLRIMGVTSKFTQVARNRLRQGVGPLSDSHNMLGQLTVTQYNKLRYAFNPTFVGQRVGDSLYYSILYGFAPVGRVLKGANAELQKITDNIGRTSLGRYFSMDQPEFATVTNFTEGIKSSMQEMGLKDRMVGKIAGAPDALIASNMTNMLHARLGDIVKGTLDNLTTAAEKADPAMQAEMLAAGEDLVKSFGEWRKVYSEAAGRVLNDNEVGLQYIKDQLGAWRRIQHNADGTMDYTGLIHEGALFKPDDIGAIESFQPDRLAQELGYADSAALRRDVTGHMEKVGGEFVPVKGEHDIAWLEEQTRTTLHAHPDVTKRVLAYHGDTWDGFWNHLARGVDEGGLDISPHYAQEAQTLIAGIARERGMDPWEYLSGVMAANLGPKDLGTSMGQLVAFLKGGGAEAAAPADLGAYVRAHLDPSAQKVLVDEWGHGATASKPAAWGSVVPKSAPGKAARPPVAALPTAFKAEPGYVYRVENPEAVLSGWPARTGVSTGAPTTFYQGKGVNPEGIFRTKADETALDAGRHGAGGADRLTKRHTPPENIEMLTDTGWVALGKDPVDEFFNSGINDMLKARVASGPHPSGDVEAAIQQVVKLTQGVLKETPEAGGTRSQLRQLVEAIPTAQAAPFSRTHALGVALLKDKIGTAQDDIFRLAEMQTKRTFLERSINHPVFGLYPASYMWGKVLPETMKFLAKNPYAATYVIADVERAIAIQREYDPEMQAFSDGLHKSAIAFLLDYLTPGLPWSDHAAHLSAAARDSLAGTPGLIFPDELKTVDPRRWVAQVAAAVREGSGLVNNAMQPSVEQGPVSNLQSIVNSARSTPTVPSGPSQITGPVSGSGLAPILQDDLARLSSILLGGSSPNQ